MKLLSESSRADWIMRAMAVAFVPTALLLVHGPLLDPDIRDYVGLWRKLVAGVVHTCRDDTLPKPLPVTLNGALFGLTGSFAVLSVVSIVAGASTAALLGGVVHHLHGAAAGWWTVLLLAVQPQFVQSTLEGGSDVQELFFVAMALWLFVVPSQPPYRRIGLCLFAAGICRPDIWPLYLLGAVIAVAFRRRLPPGALWAMGVPLAAPLCWLGFDWMLSGDPLFAFHNTTTYAERHTDETRASGELATMGSYVWVIGRQLASMTPGAVLALGAWGALRTLQRRPIVTVLCLLASLGVLAFYFLSFRSGIQVRPRFLILPVVAATFLGGPALAELQSRLAEGLNADLPRRAASTVLGMAFLVYPIIDVVHYSRHVATLFASVVEEMGVALDSIRESDPKAAQRRYFTSPRRKSQIALQTGSPGEFIEHPLVMRVDEFKSQASASIDYILYDPRDFITELQEPWSFLAEPPPGFQPVSPIEGVDHLRVYVRSGL